VRPWWSHRGAAAVLAVCAIAFLILAGSRGLSAAALLSSHPEPQSDTSHKDYALIIGTVWGPDNRPVAGIPIKIQSATGKKAKWELVSDQRGEFAQRVPVGRQDYTIQAEIKTPKGEPKPEITVQIEDNERKDVSLHLKQQGPGKK
jgi:hypothetical protein